MFELAYACGLRAEELVSLRLGDVDLDGEQVRVEGKGRKTRFVPVGEPAMAALRGIWSGPARPAARPTRRPRGARDLLPSRRRAARSSTSDVRRRLRALVGSAPGSAACVTRTPCGTRFATHLLDGGADLRLDPGDARPRSVSTTQIYTRVESARLRSAYARSHPRA